MRRWLYGTIPNPQRQIEDTKAMSKDEAIKGRGRRRVPVMDFLHLPETTSYRDSGCSLHPACLTCPLPRCRYDIPDLDRRTMLIEKMAARRARMALLRAQGSTPSLIAREVGISERSVFRILAKEA